MESNRDWKAPLALVLAGLALFVALSGRAGPSSMVAWPRVAADKFAISPMEPSEPFPLEPTVPAPDVNPAPHPEMPPFSGEVPEKWREWFRQEKPLKPGILPPTPPNVKLHINDEYHMLPWRELGGYLWSLFTGWIAPLSQVAQLFVLLLLVWLVVRQAQRRPPATAREDITTPEGHQNGQ